MSKLRGFNRQYVLRRTDFYTVQGPEDALRLRTTGQPWPGLDPLTRQSQLHRAAMGPGIYSWGNFDDATRYYVYKSDVVPDLEIMRFSVSNNQLNRFNTLDLTALGDDAANAWMDPYYMTGVYDDRYQYIIRGTGMGTEHYFHYSVFDHLRFE
jgi:hypothetical protein